MSKARTAYEVAQEERKVYGRLLTAPHKIKITSYRRGNLCAWYGNPFEGAGGPSCTAYVTEGDKVVRVDLTYLEAVRYVATNYVP